MAIYGQPNSWTCGPFALKHALLALGVFAPEDDLARLAGSTEERGTDEPGLRRAARAYGTDLLLVRKARPGPARRELEGWLARGVPVLLCVDQWEHWLTAVAAYDGQVVVFDSKYDAPLRTEPWGTLMERLLCRRGYLRGWWTRSLYDLHPVVPLGSARFRLRLDGGRASRLVEGTTALARRWDEYARALFPLAVARGEAKPDLERFIESRRSAILDQATPVAADGLRSRAAQVVDALAFTAGLYGATLRPELEADAVRRLAGIVAEFVARDPGLPGTGGEAAAA
ncbi:MAG TPA: hypothetical protein VNI61_06285 [Gemmatimonadales bacterium]|nr:hypothetical protein [Gemmatimonadales bacterium]